MMANKKGINETNVVLLTLITQIDSVLLVTPNELQKIKVIGRLTFFKDKETILTLKKAPQNIKPHSNLGQASDIRKFLG